MHELDPHSSKVCKAFLDYLFEVNKADSSIKFFRRDFETMLIWLFIMKSYSEKKQINIEDIARQIAPASKISKPSLRLILENGKRKGFLKFSPNLNDQRSWIIEPENVTINEFKMWCKLFA